MKNCSSYLLHLLMACVLLTGLTTSAGTASAHLQLDNRDGQLMTGTAWVSPTASGENTGALKVDGSAATNWTTGAPTWDTRSVEDGWHTLSLSSPETARAEVLVLNSASVVIHEGTLTDDEVWDSGVVHVVRNWVQIPEGKRLVIPNGAVVKFCEGTGLQNRGMLSAIDATLTALNDDTIGGDTNLDNGANAPADGTYAIRNNGILTAIHCDVRYATADSLFASTTIADGAFADCDAITAVEIPAEVTTVGANAFQDCDNLKEVTFLGSGTTVDDSAFNGCANLQRVNLAQGIPQTEYTFGNANPTIYVNAKHAGSDPLPDTWNGYTVTTYSSQDTPIPGDDGEPGQVLTKTEDGYEWQDIPVDDELNASSKNALQNKVVTAVLRRLEDADTAMQGDIVELKSADTAMQGDILSLSNDMTTASQAFETTVTALQTKDRELASAQTSLRTDLTSLQRDVSSLNNTGSLIQIDVSALKNADIATKNDLDTLKATLNGLVAPAVEEDEAGQVLTKTPEGVEWQTLDVTIDDALNADSEHAVQNKVITAVITGLSSVDASLQTSVNALQTKNQELVTVDTALKDEVRNLKLKATEFVAKDNELQTANDTLSQSLESQGNALASMQDNLTALQSSINTHTTDINTLMDANATTQTTLTNIQISINAFRTNITNNNNTVKSLQGTVTELQTANRQLIAKLDTLLQILDGGKANQVLTKHSDGTFAWEDVASTGTITSQVLTINLEEGWNLVAMPGNVVQDESSNAMLANVEIYTFDKTQQVFHTADGLKPLTSYWMRAPKACTIHFATPE